MPSLLIHAIELSRNVNIALTLCVYCGLSSRWLKPHTIAGRLIFGLVAGLTAVLCILSPWQVSPGIFFDGRSVVVGLAGAFGGPWTAGTAALVACVFRLSLGGDGAMTGSAVILSSAVLGVFFARMLYKHNLQPGPLNLYLFGLAVHLAMLAWMLTLPGAKGPRVLGEVTIPVLLTFPIATMLVGWLLSKQNTWLESEEKFRALYQTMAQGVVYRDASGAITSANPAAERLLGRSFLEIRGRTPNDPVWPGVQEDGSPFPKDAYPSSVALRTGERVPASVMGLAKQDAPSLQWFQVHAVPQFRNGEKKPYQVFTTFEDITQLRERGLEISRLNRLYEVISRVNQVILRGSEQAELLSTICRDMVDFGRFRFVAIAKYDETDQRARFLARAAEDQGLAELDEIRFSRLSPQSRNPIATSILENRTDICNDIQADPRVTEQVREIAQRRAFKGYASLPIRLHGKVWGAFAICAAEPDFFHEGEVRLLEEVTHNIEFALEGLEKDQARRRAEEDILHLNRVYSVLSAINQTIVRVRDRRTLYEESCRIVVDLGRFSGAWIGLAGEKPSEVHAAAVAGASLDDYLNAIRSGGPPEWQDVGLMGIAIREGRHAICNDTRTDPVFAPWKDEAFRHGFLSVAAFPLKIGGRCIGGFAQYAGSPDFFTPEEVRLLDELASDISFAVEFLEQEELRERAESALLESEARFASAFHNAATGMALVSPEGRLEKVNVALCAILGYSENELLGKTIQDLSHPADLAMDRSLASQMLAGEFGAGQLEKRYLHKSGRIVWAQLNRSLIRASDGQPLFITQILDITLRRRAEEERRRSDERYRKLVEHFPLGIVNTYDRNLRMTFAGGADARKLLGAAPESLVGKQLREIAAKETWEVSEPHMLAAFEGNIANFETSFNNLIFRVTAAPLVEADGTIDEILLVAQNVTEQRQMEMALLRGEHEQREIARQLELERTRLVEAQEVAGVGSWECDLTNLDLSWSDQTYRMFETDRASYQPRYSTFLDWVHPDDRARVDSTFRGTFHSNKPGMVDHRIVMPDGRVKFVEERWQAFQDAKGQPVRAIGTCLDITGRVLAEDEIHSARQRLDYHVDNSPLAAIEFDSMARVQRWSRQAEEVFGWRHEDVVGKSPSEWPFIYPDDLASVNKVMDSLVNGREMRNFSTNRNFTKDGRVVYCEWYNSAMFGRDGRVISVLSLGHDVTDRILAERELFDSQEKLRAVSGHLETLREAERTRMSREIHDELGQMLTAIKMDIRWLEDHLDVFGDDRRVNPLVDKLVETASLTDETIKTVQRIAADLRPGILDKLGLTTALHFEAGRFEERTGIHCRFLETGDILPIRGEVSTVFFRIFQESLTNVFRHAHANNVEVELRQEGDGYSLDIRDDGKGISVSDLSNTTSLGLLGMQERARLVGGAVSIAQRTSGGTIVKVHIPNSLVGLESN
jgi:PAS domain S-box-containing protein